MIRDDLGGAWDYGEGAVLGWALALESLIEDDSSLCLFCVTDDLAAPNPADIYQELDAQAIDQLMQNDPDLVGQSEAEKEDQSWWDWTWDNIIDTRIGRTVIGSACGAVAGAITGGITGFFLGGPAGIIAGAGRGAIEGAIGGAISGALSNNVRDAVVGGAISGAISGVLGPLAKAVAGTKLFGITVPKPTIGGPGLVAWGTAAVAVTVPAIPTLAVGAGVGTAVGISYMSGKPSDSTPQQNHHFATDKHSKYTEKFKEIADKYGLDLNGEWNKQILSHQGRHPHDYHEFVLKNMKRAELEAGTNKQKFLELFKKYVTDPVNKNPEMLRKPYWNP